jgi:hypothetical protein
MVRINIRIFLQLFRRSMEDGIDHIADRNRPVFAIQQCAQGETGAIFAPVHLRQGQRVQEFADLHDARHPAIFHQPNAIHRKASELHAYFDVASSRLPIHFIAHWTGAMLMTAFFTRSGLELMRTMPAPVKT